VTALRKPRRAVSESQLVTAILKALHIKGVFAWRANSGTQVIGASGSSARRVIRGAPAGTPDILLVVPIYADIGAGCPERIGMLAGLEVKSQTGKQLPSQKAWQEQAELEGVRYDVVRSIAEALAAVMRWRIGGK